MRFKELDDSHKDYFATIYLSTLSHEEKTEILSDKFGVVKRTVRSWADKLGLSNKVGIGKTSKDLREAFERDFDEDVDILLVTAAQNKTPVHKDFWASLLMYKGFWEKQGLSCSIVVAPAQYRNPTMENDWANKENDKWWVEEVKPYLYYRKLYFGDSLISADSRIRPTAKMPLTGYESLAADHNLILPHSRIHFKTLPRFKGQRFRTMNTTGFCTVKNYSKSKSGDQGFIHHAYGFTIVEKKNKDVCYKPRPVKVNSDGSFTDMIVYVTPNGCEFVNDSKGVVLGDIHHDKIDDRKMESTKLITDIIKPKYTVLHDVLDASTVNPHEVKDFFIQKRKILEGKYEVDKEVLSSIDFLKKYRSIHSYTKTKVVQSNHDDFLDRWVNDFNWKRDLHNSHTYLKYAAIQQSVDIDLRDYGNIYGYLLSKEGFDYLKNYESFFIGEYQSGHHGEHGINGARGSINSFKKLNQKMIHGHAHSPAIIDGVICVGVSCLLWQYYNSKGMSSWAHADAIVHDSGKNQLIVYDEEYEVSNLLKLYYESN